MVWIDSETDVYVIQGNCASGQQNIVWNKFDENRIGHICLVTPHNVNGWILSQAYLTIHRLQIILMGDPPGTKVSGHLTSRAWSERWDGFFFVRDLRLIPVQTGVSWSTCNQNPMLNLADAWCFFALGGAWLSNFKVRARLSDTCMTFKNPSCRVPSSIYIPFCHRMRIWHPCDWETKFFC